jgi:hypothetical protein
MVPSKVGVITQFPSNFVKKVAVNFASHLCHIPWFDQMSNCEQDAQEHTYSTNDDVSNSKEWILTAHDGPRRNKD